MNPLRPLTFVALLVLVLFAHAKEDESTVTQAETEEAQAKINKEIVVQKAQAELMEKQKAFDEAAAELQATRKQYRKESAELREFIASQRVRESISRAPEARAGSNSEDWNVSWLNSPAARYVVRHRGFIGVELGEATDNGLRIKGVLEDSPAQIAGIQADDVISGIEKLVVSEFDDPVRTFRAVIRSYKPGSVIRLKIRREKEELEIDVATVSSLVENRGDGYPYTVRSLTEQSGGVIGVSLGKATDTGVPVLEVIEGAPASIAGIQADDVIVKVGSLAMSDLDHPTEVTTGLLALKEPGSIVRFTIERAGEELELNVAVIERNSVTRNRALLSAWQSILDRSRSRTLVADIERISAELKNLQTPNMVFVMEIEEEFGRYFDVDYGVLVLQADGVDEIHAGDILLSINEKPVRSLSHAVQHKQAAVEDVMISLKRNKRTRNVTLKKDHFSFRSILE